MSGHSHWAGIKHKKALEDAKKGKIFSKLSRIITIAVKEGGGDPIMNPKLRDAIENARSFNMPKDNIERAIKKGTGEIGGEAIESVSYEAYGPGGIPLIIEAITDNKNRTLGDIKSVLGKYEGKLAGEGSVRWMFERRGVLQLNIVPPANMDREGTELAMIDAGAEDVKWDGDMLEIYSAVHELETVKQKLHHQGYKILSSGLHWVPKEGVSPSDEKQRQMLEKLFGELAENEDVQEIYSNLAS